MKLPESYRGALEIFKEKNPPKVQAVTEPDCCGTHLSEDEAIALLEGDQKKVFTWALTQQKPEAEMKNPVKLLPPTIAMATMRRTW